jgi:RES domain-containing protein
MSSHLSLAALEALVHFDADLVPEDLQAFAIEIPDALATEQVNVDILPIGWTRQELATRAVGDEWLIAARTPVLVVPSAIVPEETNVLVNPAHAATHGVVVVARRRFVYDPRLL